MTTPLDAAISYAAETGRQHGIAAASWYDVNEENAAAILQGIEDGDPAVLDTFPFPDLSGQWADSLSGPQLVQNAIVNADDWSMTRAEWMAYWSDREADSEICDAYDMAFGDAVTDEIARRAHYMKGE